MLRLLRLIRPVMQSAFALLRLLVDASRFLFLCLCPSPALAAENLFLRKQLDMYQARNVQPKRATNVTRFTLVWLSRWFDWRHTLRIAIPETFTR
jgi:hypothetical protein